MADIKFTKLQAVTEKIDKLKYFYVSFVIGVKVTLK